MGISNLSDKELAEIIGTKGGLQEFLKDKNNLRKFMGINHMTRRRITDILKYDKGLSKADIQRAIDEVAAVHSTVTDFFG